MEIWQIVLIAVILVVVIIVAVLIILKILKDKKIKQSNERADELVKEKASTLALEFGGKDNIKAIEQRGSRVSVEIADMTKVNKEKIEAEFSNPLFMENKIIFVVGSKALEFKNELESRL